MEGLPLQQVPVIGAALRHYRIILFEVSPDDPSHMREVEYKVNAEHVGVNNLGNMVVVKGGEPIAEFAPGKWRGWHRADFHLTTEG